MEQLIVRVLRDRYRIQSLLGRQTNRRTFLAHDLQTHSPVVIKLLLFGPDFTWDDLKLFEREAEILQALDHLAIPQYLDFFEADTKLGKGFALVQSYIEARSLQEWLQSGRTFSEAELIAIAEELLKILNYLHTRQPPVIHRDIKPSNILLSDRSGNSPGQVYLVDFGSVQSSAALEGRTFTVVGTYGYTPLEQFGGRANPTSDLYSLGATLIHLITGESPADLEQQDLCIYLEQNTSIDPNLKCWLKMMIEPYWQQRIRSSQEALQALRNLQQCSLRYSPLEEILVRGAGGRKVLLSKSKEKLEVLIHPILSLNVSSVITAPKSALKTPFISQIFLVSVLMMCHIATLSYLLSISILIVLLLAAIPVIGWIIAPLILLVLPFAVKDMWLDLFAQKQLHIDQQKISYTYKVLELKFHLLPPASRKEITGLERINIVDTPNRRVHSSSLIICTDKQVYKFPNLTVSEVDWLSAEVSDWLNLPIKVKVHEVSQHCA